MALEDNATPRNVTCWNFAQRRRSIQDNPNHFAGWKSIHIRICSTNIYQKKVNLQYTVYILQYLYINMATFRISNWDNTSKCCDLPLFNLFRPEATPARSGSWSQPLKVRRISATARYAACTRPGGNMAVAVEVASRKTKNHHVYHLINMGLSIAMLNNQRFFFCGGLLSHGGTPKWTIQSIDHLIVLKPVVKWGSDHFKKPFGFPENVVYKSI